MQSLKQWPHAVAAGLLVLSASSATLPVVAQEESSERLVSAQENEPGNWLLPYGNYSSTSHSPLDEIDQDNVQDLEVAFMHAIGGSQPASVGGASPGQRSTPLVKDGYMYVANAWDNVMKIDISSGENGEVVWFADLGAQGSASKMGSVALLGDHVYYVTRSDMRLVKIDDETGEILWEKETRSDANPAGAERATGGPLAVGDKIITSAAGPGMRGWIGAFSADDGELLWRFFTVPGPGEEGHETWADDHDAYLTGGAGVWTTPSYDAERNLVVFGTGEAQPWADTSFRPGDNLYANSTVALNADTGELEWHFQEVAQETWDYDTVNPKMLYQASIDGTERQVVGTFSRNGFFYTLDRGNGEFIHGEPYRDPNWTEGLDPETGKPVEYVPGQLTQEYAGNMSLKIGEPETAQEVCPALPTSTWWPPAYDSERDIAWVQATDACFSQSIEEPIDPERDDLAGNPGMWGGGNFWRFDVAHPGAPGLIIGVDTTTGEKVQEITTDFPTNSGLLSTAGGLVFSGHPDGRLTAYSADDLSELWSFNTGTPIGAPPISFEIEGKQYVAVITGGASGGGVLANYEQAAQVVFFTLDEG